jgi:hypothetical protein
MTLNVAMNVTRRRVMRTKPELKLNKSMRGMYEKIKRNSNNHRI